MSRALQMTSVLRRASRCASDPAQPWAHILQARSGGAQASAAAASTSACAQAAAPPSDNALGTTLQGERPWNHHAGGLLRQRGVQIRTYAASSLPELAEDSESDVDEAEAARAPGLAPLPERIGFIGAGQMGEAMIRGFLKSGVSQASRLAASVRSEPRAAALARLGLATYGDALAGGAAALAAASDIIILGVKPQYLPGILRALAPHVRPRHLVLSIAAGTTLATLAGALPPGTRVVRVMPNTPCCIGAAASAYALGPTATPRDGANTHALLSAVGTAIQVEEHQMDAVTGLSGSGPAYVFAAIEALADGGVAAGLPRQAALALAAQTVVGAGRMVLEAAGDGSLTHPAVLKDKVASPAGTTITGLAALESAGFRGALIGAVRAASDRARQLGS